MSDYVLKLQQDDSILEKVRNLIWDLKTMQPGFIIQLRVHQVIQHQDQNNRNLRATKTIKPDTFLYMQDTNDIFDFLSNTLADEGVTVDTDGRLLCDDGLHLFRCDTCRTLSFPQSTRAYTFKDLTECVVKYFEFLRKNNKNKKFRKLVPISMDLTVVRFQQFQVRQIEDEVVVRINEAEKDCAICLDRLAAAMLASCTPCDHVFHKKCISRWLQKNGSSCPLCRANLSRN